MTIEGRPSIQHDWEAEYEKQRLDRLHDAIDDYLQDAQISPQKIYDDILDTVNGVIEYHQSNLDRAKQLYSLIRGNQVFEIKTSQFLAEDRISNYPYENLPANPVVTLGQDPVIFGA